jgi:hypothetical protein
MSHAKSNYAAALEDQQSSGEILILPDGRILAHNITPALARLLSELDPTDAAMRARAEAGIVRRPCEPSSP